MLPDRDVDGTILAVGLSDLAAASDIPVQGPAAPSYFKDDGSRH
ncbi:hypothetical protein QF031_003055 [Pseudarthrobacter defluvii]|nr:hypothetical protein [Pseudarthrobacter defluvii]MDQ0770306.1 hypothetical protein [Pseudarthrobacter defluvii]